MRPLERRRFRWEDKITIDLKEIGVKYEKLGLERNLHLTEINEKKYSKNGRVTVFKGILNGNQRGN